MPKGDALLFRKRKSLTFGFPKIDEVFTGFEPGEFAVLYGHPICTHLAFLLCVRSQLPTKEKGLGSTVVFNDGGNTFDPYVISAMAREYGRNPESILENIFVSRAFTAYQLAALILEKSEEALTKYRSELMVISEITTLFLDKDIPKKESFDIFVKLSSYISWLAKEKKIIALATCIPSFSMRSLFLESVLTGRASTVINVSESKKGLRFFLQKHPKIKPFAIEFPFDAVTLEDFVEA